MTAIAEKSRFVEFGDPAIGQTEPMTHNPNIARIVDYGIALGDHIHYTVQPVIDLSAGTMTLSKGTLRGDTWRDTSTQIVQIVGNRLLCGGAGRQSAYLYGANGTCRRVAYDAGDRGDPRDNQHRLLTGRSVVVMFGENASHRAGRNRPPQACIVQDALEQAVKTPMPRPSAAAPRQPITTHHLATRVQRLLGEQGFDGTIVLGILDVAAEKRASILRRLPAALVGRLAIGATLLGLAAGLLSPTPPQSEGALANHAARHTTTQTLLPKLESYSTKAGAADTYTALASDPANEGNPSNLTNIVQQELAKYGRLAGLSAADIRRLQYDPAIVNGGVNTFTHDTHNSHNALVTPYDGHQLAAGKSYSVRDLAAYSQRVMAAHTPKPAPPTANTAPTLEPVLTPTPVPQPDTAATPAERTLAELHESDDVQIRRLRNVGMISLGTALVAATIAAASSKRRRRKRSEELLDASGVISHRVGRKNHPTTPRTSGSANLELADLGSDLLVELRPAKDPALRTPRPPNASGHFERIARNPSDGRNQRRLVSYADWT